MSTSTQAWPPGRVPIKIKSEMRRLFWTFAALAVGVLCSCSKEAMSSGDDNAISLVPVMDKEAVLTRGASLYQDENSLRSDLFHTRAYLSGTTDTYFSSHVKYSTENVDDASKHQWLFYTPAVNGNAASYDNYYWPLTNSLDFFAYAPVGNGYVEPNYSTNPPHLLQRCL